MMMILRYPAYCSIGRQRDWRPLRYAVICLCDFFSSEYDLLPVVHDHRRLHRKNQKKSEATAVAAASGDFVPLKVLRLLHAQTTHVLPGVFERCYPIAITAAAAGAGRIAVERPETRDRKTVGDHKRVNRVDVLQAGTFNLDIGPAVHHCNSAN